MISTLVHSEGTKRTEEYMEVISRRLEMERKYILLIDQFKNDYKRQFMIRKNFYAYLKAIKFLYSMNGTSTAPSSIYHIISEAESCFNQLNYFQPKK
ncbi:MAG: hypothetical protein QG620_570 [Patescibacteria group bacterium]|nr:hypothetical protein [Patescibacteria group bacterium]